MTDRLLLNTEKYEIRTQTEAGLTITYRVFPHITYVENPVSEKYETMSIYVPEVYYHNGSVNGWTAETAPVFMPNVVGAYAAAVEDEPGRSSRGFNKGDINAAFMALFEGMVVACPAARGRGAEEEEGKFIGNAPAGLVDLKAAVRYLKHNAGRFPGDTAKIITNGTSAGGAMSALLGTTGDCAAYDEELKAIGAADESDVIFGASCYCPITNLDHADMAYEWLLKGFTQFTSMRMIPKDGRVVLQEFVGDLSEEQLKAGDELRGMFIEYLNSLKLKDENGDLLCLDADGEGTFREYVASILKAGAQKALDGGVDLSDKRQVTIENGVITDFDLKAHVQDVGRMKPVPSFDEWGGHSPENEVFGSLTEKARHFTDFGQAHDKAGLTKAPEDLIRKMNPMYHLDGHDSTRAAHIRIRHGSHDPHTSWAIPTILATALKNQGADVDFALYWGKPHSGDYDMRELFDWIREICQ